MKREEKNENEIGKELLIMMVKAKRVLCSRIVSAGRRSPADGRQRGIIYWITKNRIERIKADGV